jgi:hypothetical protein
MCFCNNEETINIYFFNVIMLNSYGEHCMLSSVYEVLQVLMICLQVGY